MLIVTIVLFFVILVVVILYLLWITDNLFGGEDFTTSKEAIQQIGKIIMAHNYQTGLLYDLGSSQGGFVFKILDVCLDLEVVGIDKSRIRIWSAKLRRFFHPSKKVPRFLKMDIFDIDVSKINLAFVYLPRPMLPNLEEKLQKNLKPGSLVITYRVHFPNWQPKEVFKTDFKKGSSQNNIFVYRQV